MHAESHSARDRRALRRTLAAAAVIAAVAVAAVVTSAALSHDDNSATPQHTVRDFLISAVVDRNGFVACRYATRRSVLEVRAKEPHGTACEEALTSAAHLSLGGEPVDTEAAVKALAYRTTPEPDGRVRVTVSAHGASRSFVLRRGTSRELGEFMAPPTPWRIDSGFAELVGR